MKKSKIFALLLTISLMFGAISMFAFASDDKDPLDASQYGEGITGKYFTDAETFVDLSETDLNNKLIMGSTSSPGNYGSGGNFLESVATKALKGSVGNKYVGVTSRTTEQGTDKYTNTFYGTFIGTASDAMKYYDYYVASVDFMADDRHSDGTLSYIEGSFLGAYSTTLSYKYTYFVKDAEGNWYLANAKTYDTASRKVALEKEVGAWNNYTIVFSRATKTGGIYINGECLLPLTDITTSIYVDRIVLNLSGATKGYFSMGFDNGCAAAYGSYVYDGEGNETAHIPYNSGAKFGLDDYFALGDTTLNIDFCEDIVANSEYGFNTLAGQGYDATVISGDKRTNYYTVAAALDAANDGDTVEIRRNVGVTNLADCKSVTVVSKNGSTVSVASSVVAYESGNVYKLTGLSANVENPRGSHFSSNLGISGWGNSGAITTAVSDGVLKITATNRTADTSIGTNKSGNKYFLLASGTNLSTEMVKDYSHWLLDFDIGLLDGGIYCDGMSISVFDNKLGAYYDFFFTVKDSNGNWYLGNKDTYAASTSLYKLPSEAGVSTHITVIANVNRQNVADSGYYVYANGEYINRASHYTKSATVAVAGNSMHPERFCFDFSAGLAISKDIAFYIDNYDIFRYGSTVSGGTPYNSGMAFGIDDYIALGDMTLPIYHCVDVVASSLEMGEYVLSNSESENTKTFSNLNAALAFAANGDTLTVPGDITLIPVLDSGVKQLTVNGGNVSFAGDAAKVYSLIDGIISGRDFYKVHWYDLEKYVRSEVYLLLESPDFSGWQITTSEIKGVVNIPGAWNVSVNGDAASSFVDYVSFANGDRLKMTPGVVEVTWYQADGVTVDATELWFAGNKASRSLSALNATLEILDNGWYELSYFWNSSKDDMIVKGESMNFKPVIEPISALDIKFNFMLGASSYPIFYIPREIDGVEIDKVYINSNMSVQNTAGEAYTSVVGPITDLHHISEWSNTQKALKDVTQYKTEYKIGTNTYYRYQGSSISIFAWYNITGFQTEFTVTYNGEEYSIHSTPAIVSMPDRPGAVSYVRAVFGTESNPKSCSNETMLIANWMQYISYSYSMQGTNILLSAVENLLTAHVEHNPGCTCINRIEDMIPTEAPEGYTYGSFGNLENVGTSYLVTKENGLLAIYIPKEYVPADKSVKVYATLKGIAYNSQTGTTQTAQKITISMNPDMTDGKMNETSDGRYLFIAAHSASKICNANEDVTITVEVDGEVIGSATYALSVYIYNTLQKNNLYKFNAESGKYEINTEVLNKTESGAYKYTLSQRAYQATLALAAFSEAAYDYMTYGTEAER